MKKPHYFLAIISIFLFSTCKKEPLTPDIKTAGLQINIGVKVHELDVYKIQKSTNAIEDYKVIIQNSEGNLIAEYERAADIPDTVKLAPGSYIVTAHSNNLVDAAFDTPYYYGQSNVINLNEGEIQNLSVTCTMANCAVTITYSDNIKNNFDTYSTVVSNANGELIFNEDETRTAYFSLLPLTIESTLSYLQPDNTTATKILTGNIAVPEGQKLYDIFLDALPDETGISILLNENPEVSTQQIVLTDGSTARKPETSDLIITEILANPDALADNEGEYIELYNTTNSVISLNGLIFKENGTTAFTIDTDAFIPPSGYFTIAASENVPFSPDLISADISLTNSGEILGLYYLLNEVETEIFTLDYGAANFPGIAGASIELSTNHLNATDAVDGLNWCTAVSDAGNTDLGTPGKVNDCTN